MALLADAAAELRSMFGLRRGDEQRALTRANVPAVMLAQPTAGVPVTPRTALAVADVYAAVRALTDTISTLPLIAYRRTAQGRERHAGALADLLTRPAPAVPAYAFLGHLATSIVMHGDAFVALYRDGDGVIFQLGVLDPTRVQVEVRGGLPLYTITTLQGRRETVTDHDVLHIRSPLTLDGVRGLSPIAACREAVETSAAMSRHAARTMANDARPSGVLQVPGGPEQADVMENLSKAWSLRHEGPDRSGRIAVLAGDITFTSLSIPAGDLQFVEQRQLSTAEIARIFRLPPWILGAKSGDSLTYSNVESQGLAFLTHSLRPWLVAIEQSFSAHPALCPGADLYVEFLVDALLRTDAQTRATIYATALDETKGWMSRAEVRRLENLPPEAAPERIPDAA